MSQQFSIFRYSALGACTELSAFFLKLLEPKIFENYLKVTQAVQELHDPELNAATRRKDEPFHMRALLVNMMTNEHKDPSDWNKGFAAFLPVGKYEGGDIMFRELGIRIKSRPGCVQLFRGHELRHSITKWTGRRFCVVQANHGAVKRWAIKKKGSFEDKEEVKQVKDQEEPKQVKGKGEVTQLKGKGEAKQTKGTKRKAGKDGNASGERNEKVENGIEKTKKRKEAKTS